MTYRQARVEFSRLIARLLLYMNGTPGYEAAYAEGMDRKTAKDPTSDHMDKSLHELGLAQDIDLYLQGQYIRTTEGHARFGEVWESMHPLCRWGGRFGDGNHYSFAPPEIVGNRR